MSIKQKTVLDFILILWTSVIILQNILVQGIFVMKHFSICMNKILELYEFFYYICDKLEYIIIHLKGIDNLNITF